MERAPFSVEWLAQARIDRNWTQEQVAEHMKVEIKTVRRWEQGLHQPHIRQYQRLCLLFDREQKQPQDAPPPFPDQETAIVQHREGRQTFHPAALHETDDTYTRFRARNVTLPLLRLVLTWSLRDEAARYQALQTLLMQELEREDNNTMHEQSMSRRSALRYLASLPIELHGLSLLTPDLSQPYPYEEVLTQCAGGITACWYLRKGKDLAFASDVVSRYIPTLKEIVIQGPSDHRQDAADLLAQGLLLKATCVNHISADHTASLRYAKQAETYSNLAGNLALAIAAIKKQASAYDYADNWEQAMHTTERAKQMIETTDDVTVSSFVQSYVYAGLANYQGHCNRKQGALTSVRLAEDMLNASSNEPAQPLWIDYNRGSMLIHCGLAYYHLDMQEEAIRSFAGINDLEGAMETTRTESFTDQVMAEVNREDKPRDMDFCIDRWETGIQRAIAMRSKQAFAEAKVAYAAMRGAWPTEQRVKKLGEQIKHW